MFCKGPFHWNLAGDYRADFHMTGTRRLILSNGRFHNSYKIPTHVVLYRHVENAWVIIGRWLFLSYWIITRSLSLLFPFFLVYGNALLLGFQWILATNRYTGQGEAGRQHHRNT
jgi:hypothetical protein